MIDVDGSRSQFTGISITKARIDSKLPDGVTLCFCLAPTPVANQWKAIFANLGRDKHASVISTTNPLLHEDSILWKVVEGDIPNAKHYVTERVAEANVLFEQMLVDTAPPLPHEVIDVSEAEIDRLQRMLDES